MRIIYLGEFHDCLKLGKTDVGVKGRSKTLESEFNEPTGFCAISAFESNNPFDDEKTLFGVIN